MANRHLPALLVIMDGFGLAADGADNAVSAASKPYIDELLATYPHTTLGASGEDVGLPEGQMGNSEVGHLNIGAGRIIFQELSRINNAIKDGSLKENEVFTKTMDDVASAGKTLHLMGLMSPGGVHSMQSHCEALVAMAAERGVKTVRVHCFMDGRDVDPTARWATPRSATSTSVPAALSSRSFPASTTPSRTAPSRPMRSSSRRWTTSPLQARRCTSWA